MENLRLRLELAIAASELQTGETLCCQRQLSNYVSDQKNLITTSMNQHVLNQRVVMALNVADLGEQLHFPAL